MDRKRRLELLESALDERERGPRMRWEKGTVELNIRPSFFCLGLTSRPPSLRLSDLTTATTEARAHPATTAATETSKSSVGVGSQRRRSTSDAGGEVDEGEDLRDEAEGAALTKASFLTEIVEVSVIVAAVVVEGGWVGSELCL